MKDVRTAIMAQIACADEIKSDFITLQKSEGKRILELLKKQEAEIRQLRLALDIAKGTCKGIKVESR